MEEIREIALAYYANLQEEEKELARSVFKSVDFNDDGRLTIDEFARLFRDSGENDKLLQILTGRSFFKEFDKNEDGFLNFKEFIVFYYLITTRRIKFCCGHECEAFLKGIFFACPFCFNTSDCFVVCLACYRNNNYYHEHPILLDNYALLMSSEALQDKQPSSDNSDESSVKVIKFLNVVHTGYQIGNVAVTATAAAAACCIM
ncbi:hypothetical protein UlMin_010144 [Ulmus minor]